MSPVSLGSLLCTCHSHTCVCVWVPSTYRALVCFESDVILFPHQQLIDQCFFCFAADEHKAVSATAAMNSLIGYMGDSHATSKLRENRLLRCVIDEITRLVELSGQITLTFPTFHETNSTRCEFKYLCFVSGVFKTINSTVNGILSLGEVLDMAGRLELFLTEEEGSRIYALMDTDGDEKVNQQHLRTVYSAAPFCSLRTF